MNESKSCPRSRPVGTSKAPESRWNAKTGPNEVNGNVSPAAGNAKTFRFDLLPAELQAQIIQSLESSFFCENVRRLVVSKSWAHWALKAMYEDMVISKASNPLAPMRISGNEFNSGYVSASTNNLERHLRVVRLHLDHLFRSYQFLPDDTDLRQHKDRLTMMNRRKAACAGNEQRPMNTWSKLQPENEPTTIQSMLIMSVELMAYIYASQRVHTLDLKIREPWGLRRSHVSAFEAVLSVALVKKQLSHLQLDLAGLGARKQSCQSRTVERVSDANEPLPLHHLFGDRNVATMNRALEMVDQWNQRHVCNGIMHALPHLETLHYRSRCICPGIFRWQLPEEMERWRQMWPSFDGWPAGISHAQALTEYGERAETALPKLKEVVINMALPRESFKHTRVVHCMTFDANLTREAENHYAEYAVKEMKREMTRFVRRLDHPRIVRLRYSRMVGTRLDREYIDEFDALTGETRTRPVDRWGEVVDLEE